jgi:hypothetical protein
MATTTDNWQESVRLHLNELHFVFLNDEWLGNNKRQTAAAHEKISVWLKKVARENARDVCWQPKKSLEEEHERLNQSNVR